MLTCRRDFFPLPSASASRSCPTPTCSLPEAPLLNSPPLPAIPASASSLSSPPSADSPMRRDWRDAVVAEERDAGGAGGEAFWRKVFERTGSMGEGGNGSAGASPSTPSAPVTAAAATAAAPAAEAPAAPAAPPVTISVIKVDDTLLLLGTSHGHLQVWHLPSHSLLASLHHPLPLPLSRLTLSESLGDPPLGPDSCSRAVTADACNEDRWCACNEDIWCACNEDGWRLVASAAEDGSVCVWSLPRWPTRGDGSSTPQALRAGANVREAGSEVVPAGSEVVPAGSEVVPAGSEVVPAGLEVVPAGFQVVQEGSAEALLAGSTSERRGFGGTCVAIVPCAAPWCSLWFVQGAMGEQQLWQDLERVGRGEGNTEGGEGGAGGEGGEGEKGEGEQVRWRPRKGKRGPREWWEGGAVTERRTCKGETPCPRPRYLLVEGRDGGTDIFSSYSMRLWDLGSAGSSILSASDTTLVVMGSIPVWPRTDQQHQGAAPNAAAATGVASSTVQGGFPGVFARLWDVDASAVAALPSQVRPTLPGAPYTPTLPGVPSPPTCALPATDAPSPEQVRPLPNRCVLPPTSAPSPPRPIPHSPRFSTWTPSSSQQPPPPFPPSFSPLFLQACPPFTDILHLDSQQPCIAPYSATAVVLRADGLVALWTGIKWPDHTVPICPDTVGAVRVCKYCAIEFKGGACGLPKEQAHVGELYAFGKDMSASAVVARLRLSLRLKRKWRPFGQGVGIMAASLAGRSFYPSASYATLNANVDVGRINVVGAGKAPLDDYSGHETAKMRYGDYMSATMDEEGNAWAAVQYVAGQPRTEWSNWGTFVFKCGRLGMGCMGSGADGWGHWTVRGGEGEELGRCLRQARM
ncbi:unnamed protein product [Closterium sp. NIES-64]|nr:unnamed protein product [Closterium sp. NIES-64]